MKNMVPCVSERTSVARRLTPQTKSRVLVTKYGYMKAHGLIKPSGILSYFSLNSDQQSLFPDFVRFLMTCGYKGGSLFPTKRNSAKYQVLKDRFLLQLGHVIDRLPREAVDEILKYIHLQRWDSSGELNRARFVEQMYDEFLNALKISNAPSFQEIIHN